MIQTIYTRIVFLTVLVISALAAHASDKTDSKEYAEGIRRQVWSQDLPEFLNPQHTDRFADKSEVIIAAYDEYVVSKENRNSFLNSLTSSTELSTHDMMRRLVQINDKAALERYSEFDYLAFASHRVPFYGKMEVRNVLGVRIFKPDGTVREVSTDEFVVTSEGRKGKEERQKLAVPGLEVGDIIDVFYFRITNAKNMAPEPMTFFFVSDFPMLSYRVHCEIDHDLPCHYRTLNGAPDFTLTTNDINDYVLDVSVKDVEQTEPSLWYVTAMQTPFTLLYVQVNSPLQGTTLSAQSKRLMANPHADVMQADDWNFWNNRQRFIGMSKKEKAVVKDALEKFADDEQWADYLYEYLLAYEVSDRMNQLNQINFVLSLRALFDKAHIPYQCGITTDERRESIDELAYYSNTIWFLRLPNGKCYFAPTFACRPGELPYHCQGRKAVVCTHPKQKLTEGPYESITLPQNEAKDNMDSIVIAVRIDGTRLHVNRARHVSGALRQDLSLILPTRDELVRSVMERHSSGKTRQDLYDKKYAEVVAEQEAEDRKTQREMLKEEASAYYGMAFSEMGEGKVHAVGTTAEKPTLSFEADFVLDGMVKRAGQDLTLAIGKLLGIQLKIEEKERKRDVDIVREMPICDKWDITISLPEGYTVNAFELERLQTKVSNAVGQFSTTLSLENGKLHLKAEKTILHKREPVTNWPLILELYDHIYDYFSRNIIIQRI